MSRRPFRTPTSWSSVVPEPCPHPRRNAYTNSEGISRRRPPCHRCHKGGTGRRIRSTARHHRLGTAVAPRPGGFCVVLTVADDLICTGGPGADEVAAVRPVQPRTWLLSPPSSEASINRDDFCCGGSTGLGAERVARHRLRTSGRDSGESGLEWVAVPDSMLRRDGALAVCSGMGTRTGGACPRSSRCPSRMCQLPTTVISASCSR